MKVYLKKNHGLSNIQSYYFYRFMTLNLAAFQKKQITLYYMIHSFMTQEVHLDIENMLCSVLILSAVKESGNLDK